MEPMFRSVNVIEKVHTWNIHIRSRKVGQEEPKLAPFKQEVIELSNSDQVHPSLSRQP